MERIRTQDEGGNLSGVFSRIGARPLNLAEQRRLCLRGGEVWRVSDDPRHPMYGKLRPYVAPKRWRGQACCVLLEACGQRDRPVSRVPIADGGAG